MVILDVGGQRIDYLVLREVRDRRKIGRLYWCARPASFGSNGGLGELSPAPRDWSRAIVVILPLPSTTSLRETEMFRRKD